MKKHIAVCILIFVSIQFVYAQKMTVKDSDTNILMEVNDEGTMGSITLPDTNAVLSSETNKLYNLNGALIWNGTALVTTGSAGGWTDGGTSVYLTTDTDKVGIGDSSPTQTLDVSGTIGIHGTQVLFVPEKSSDFVGTFIVGNGGINLTQTTDPEGRYNTGIGIGPFLQNTTGYNNTASGYGALQLNTTGYDNTASGCLALQLNTSGYANTATGYRAHYSNTIGNWNTSIGFHANYYNQEGSNNTMIGNEAGKGVSEHNKSGNVFIGNQAGYNETGDNKLYIENSSSSSPLIGGDFSTNRVGINTGSPNNTLDVNGTVEMTGFLLSTSPSTGYVLTSDASGNGTWQAASSTGGWTDDGTVVRLTTGTDKVGIGDTSPTNTLDVAGTIGINDTQLLYLPNQGTYTGTLFIGDGGGSLDHIGVSDGRHNTGIGIGALNAITRGDRNTATGYQALYTNTLGFYNTATGSFALFYNTTGNGNTAMGNKALFSNTTGLSNTADGSNALYSNTDGDLNTANGTRALYSNTGGGWNTASGYEALNTNTTGDYNTAIGYRSDVSGINLTNATAIGANASVNASNKVRIGDDNVTVIEGEVPWSYPSDRNKKENFLDVDGEYVLNSLREFDLCSWNYIGHDPVTKRHYGPVAQDFFHAFGQDNMGTIGNETTLCSSDVAGINMIAVQALEKRTKELLMKNEKLEAEVSELRKMMAGLMEKNK
jgi:hypothetical protein